MQSQSQREVPEDCEMLKSVLEEVKGAISEYTMQLGRFQAEDYLYGAKNAAAKIFEWRGYILRAETRISTSGKLSILWREMKHL